MFCSNCGNVLVDGAKFCSSCGKQVDISSASVCEEIVTRNEYSREQPENGQNNNEIPLTKSKTEFLGKNYVNTSIGANLWRNEISLGGKIYFFENHFIFKTHAVNFEQVKFTISYKDITDIQFANYFGLAPTGLQITMNDKKIYRFVVWHRKKIKEFLEYKMKSC